MAEGDLQWSGDDKGEAKEASKLWFVDPAGEEFSIPGIEELTGKLCKLAVSEFLSKLRRSLFDRDLNYENTRHKKK